jgi:hypothetical protein
MAKGIGICDVCVAKTVRVQAKVGAIEVFPACVIYRDEPQHWGRLYYECPLVKTIVGQIMADSEGIEAEVRRLVKNKRG